MPNQPPNNLNPYKQAGASFEESRGFSGVDLWTDPRDQTGNMLLRGDNTVNRAGMLETRPGMVGLFGGTIPSSSSMSPGSSSSSEYYDVGNTYYSVPTGPLYGLCDFNDAVGNMWMIIADGNGRIYRTQQASGFYTELLDTSGQHYAFNAAVTDCVRIGSFAYFVDGAHTLARVDLTGGFPAYAMLAPTTNPNVGLTNISLFQANNGANWSFDGQSTAYTNVLPNAGQYLPTGSLDPPGSSNMRGNGWVITNEQGQGQGGWPQQVNIISGSVNITIAGGTDATGGYVTIPALSGNSLLYPSRFHFQLQTNKNDFGSNPNTYTGLVIITPFDSNHNQLGNAARVVINPAGNTWIQIDTVIDFSGFGPNVAFVKLQIVNTNAASDGNLYVGGISLIPISVQTQFVTGNSALLVIPTISGGAVYNSSSSSLSPGSSSSFSSFAGNTISNPPSDLGSILDYQGTSFTFTFPGDFSSSSLVPTSSSSSSGMSEYPTSSSSNAPTLSGVDLSTTNRLVIGLGGISSWQGVDWALWLRDWNGVWVLADNGTFVSADQTGLDCDISTLTVAQLSNVTALKLTFGTNINWVAPFYALQLGPITSPGNLSVGDANYQYYVTETAVIDAFNQVQSNPSLPSVPMTPTFAQAECTVVIPTVCPVNTPETNQYNFYRLGGVYSDIRLIASVSRTVSVAYGSDSTNPYYGWNAVTGVFTDNTPDIFLAVATLMSFSRDPMPANAQACVVWEGRFVEAVGNTLYVGWLYNSDNSAALMTTLVSNLDDPNYPICGASFPVTADPSDTVVRMVPYGTPVEAGNAFGGGLVIFCKRSVWMLQGTDASNFSLRQYPYNEGVGLIAFRGVARSWTNQVIFMGPDRLHVFPPQGDNPNKDMGLPIQPQLYPVTPQALQNQSAFSKSWMLFHDSKLFLGCPIPGGTSNSVVWLYDFRTGGWLRWTGPSDAYTSSSSLSSLASSSSGGPSFSVNGMAITGGMSLPPNNNGADYDLYLFGLDGQLYRMTGYVDQSTPTSYQQPIPVNITVHAMRPGFYYRYKLHPLYYMRARLEWAEVELVLTGQVVITAQAYTTGGQNPVTIPGAKSLMSYTLANLGRPFRYNLPPGLIEGDLITLSLSYVSQGPDPAYLRGVRGFISGTGTEQV